MLNDKVIKNAQPTDKRWSLKDSDRLFLEIMPGGSKYWRFRYSFQNKPGRLTFGEYPLVSLKEAREMRDEARILLKTTRPRQPLASCSRTSKTPN